MDSDKIFIGFVMKQFEFIEEGHIPQTELLLPKIVDFLVRLSYEKYHSKMIIGMPKIIQLCDGLMASGQAPQTHCIPALVPVVEEMFLMKNPPSNPNEEKELETTREVLMSMMLRLAEYPAIIELIARCLTESRGSNCGNGEEKWRRWSRQALDTILPMLSSRKVRLEFNEANFALIKLFSAASPTVFRPVDPLLKVLLAVPPSINQSSHDLPLATVVDFQRWLVTVNSSLLAIVSYAKEEAMLSRLADVAITFPELADILMLKSDVKRSLSGDPLNVSGRMEPELIIPPERILARFLLRAVEMIATVLLDVIQGSAVKFLNCQGDFKDENQLVQQSGLFLQLLNTSDCDLPELEHIFNRGNLEPRSSEKDQAFSQLSVSYLWCQCSLHADKLSSSVLKLKKRRDNALANSALDVNSCLYFLLDLYNSWLSPSAKVPLRLLHELIKSLLFVSDLFSERSHFQWMLESCLDLWKAQVADDEILHRYLILAICKSVAVLTPLDTETLDKVRRIVDSSLKCGSISMRLATLHGTLYILQSAVLADCEETMSTVHSASIEYITRHLNGTADNRVSSQSQEHQCLLWALVFFLLEHAEGTPPEVEAPAVLGMIMSLVSSANISSSLHRMLLQGLERLVATRSVLGKVSEQIVKISLDRLRQSNPVLSLPALQLFLTCMYTESAERFNKAEEEEESAGEGLAAADALEPEVLVRSIERSSAIFDKIKKAYPLEVEILCDVLAEVLIDFFPPMDILTKVIGEFLSPQQPYPRLMSAIVFKVSSLCSQQQQPSVRAAAHAQSHVIVSCLKQNV
ncbi:unnamed protein product [Trichogramma brassicae]|uniref:Uncharacterized protein n=1 Tax=Trichogramma brassicae TaxID=86971 RepID=A0A6H5HZ20_9HYME|nr:unnamed protein product [Trichogramma brassicae]